jgi:hypothetical protein
MFRDPLHATDRGISITPKEQAPFHWSEACSVRCARGLSSPREFHPEALPEPYVNLSIHTAPMVEVV